MGQQPSVGRVVHYVSHGTPIRPDGTQAYTAKCRSAEITEVEGGKVGLFVKNPTGQFTHPIDARGGACRYEAYDCAAADRGPMPNGGTWHWPGRVAVPAVEPGQTGKRPGPDVGAAVEIARVTHEANRALQVVLGDPVPSVPWDQAPEWQRQSALSGVLRAMAGDSPEQLHEGWCQIKAADGWVYGPVKDPKAKTHPCLVPYGELPVGERRKDHLFHAVVGALSRTAV